MKTFDTVKHRFPRRESLEKATGQAAYTEDIRLPGMVYAAIVRSLYPRAEVTDIDLSAAEKIPGYVGALLPEDVPHTRFNCSGNPPSPLLYPDEEVLTRSPRCQGDRILAVAAESEAACRAAAEAVRITYEQQKPMMTLKDALKEGADPIQPHLSETNIINHRQVSQGDVEAALKTADQVVQDHFSVQLMQHVPLEPTGCLCDYQDGQFTIYSSSQTIFQERRILAELLGVPEGNVRMIKPMVGGGFGARQQLHAQHVAAFLARKLNRPVQLIYTREEDLLSTAARHAMELDMKMGMTADGTITGTDIDVWADSGPYTTHTPTVVAAASRKFHYHSPNYRFHGRSVLTNRAVAGAFRGYGNTQVTFAREILMDRLASALHRDPVELRLQNHVQPGEYFPCASMPVTSCAVESCARRCLEIQQEIDAAEGLRWDEEVRQAWGIAFCCHGSGPSSKEGLSAAVVMLNDDGSANLLVGSCDIGQGSETMLSQIAAEELGIPLSRVRIQAADTLLTPYDTGTFGSSQTFVCGNAVSKACADAREKLCQALEKLKPGRKVVWEKGGCQVTEPSETPDTPGTVHTLSLAEAVREAMFHPLGNVIVGAGSYKAEHSPNPFAVCFVKAEYRPALHAIRLLHVIEVADVGTPINVLTVEGQLEGGIAQGIGYALYERMEYLPALNRSISTDLLHYRIPLMGDMPKLHVGIAESYEPTGPQGAKSVGELSTVPVAPAIVNAVRKASGMELTKIPLCDEFLILPGGGNAWDTPKAEEKEGAQ